MIVFCVWRCSSFRSLVAAGNPALDGLFIACVALPLLCSFILSHHFLSFATLSSSFLCFSLACPLVSYCFCNPSLLFLAYRFYPALSFLCPRSFPLLCSLPFLPFPLLSYNF
ncbi:unnamed protein product, partial [Laminaria digitata]